MTTMLPLNEVKAKFSEMVGRARDHHEEIVISIHGEPAAVLVSVYEWESMKETLDILNDPETLDAVKHAHDEPTYSPEEVMAELLARRQSAA